MRLIGQIGAAAGIGGYEVYHSRLADRKGLRLGYRDVTVLIRQRAGGQDRFYLDSSSLAGPARLEGLMEINLELVTASHR